MAKNRRKPNSARSYAGTGVRPISMDGEIALDKAIADNIEQQAQRIKILEEENAKLQLQVEQKQKEIDEFGADEANDGDE